MDAQPPHAEAATNSPNALQVDQLTLAQITVARLSYKKDPYG